MAHNSLVPSVGLLLELAHILVTCRYRDVKVITIYGGRMFGYNLPNVSAIGQNTPMGAYKSDLFRRIFLKAADELYACGDCRKRLTLTLKDVGVFLKGLEDLTLGLTIRKFHRAEHGVGQRKRFALVITVWSSRKYDPLRTREKGAFIAD